MYLIEAELDKLYKRYARMAQARKGKVLSYDEWLVYRNRMVGLT